MKTFIMLMLASTVASAQYTGTGSVSQGEATTTIPKLYECTGGRPTAVGTITATDASTWTVPAQVNFTNNNVPFASDLYNQCEGATYRTTTEALSHLTESDIVVVDADGELITAFVFADNYFELSINGRIIAKDKVPFTPFNSSIVRFRVRRPFTIAMLLVDWEEHLGLGSENNNGVLYHPGDGGMVALFRNEVNEVVAITNSAWRAQTFYTAPIKDLSCPKEVGTQRLSSSCNADGSNDGSKFYALHWPIPENWSSPSFIDAEWPFATTYTNAEIGVNNKPAYTNFSDVFDAPTHDAQFIWSSNVVLDNCVITRYTVDAPTSVDEQTSTNEVKELRVYSLNGELVGSGPSLSPALDHLPFGLFIVVRSFSDGSMKAERIIVPSSSSRP